MRKWSHLVENDKNYNSLTHAMNLFGVSDAEQTSS